MAVAERRIGERGYAMAALLVAMSVMAVLLSVALPSWRTYAQREKEAELVFRGEQYARAITLFQRRYANASPPNIDVLVNEKFLRKKYKDPITNDDFQLIGAGAAVPGQQSAAPDTRTEAGIRASLESLQKQAEAARQAANQLGAGRAGAPGGVGIVGVTSKSPMKSFRLYRGRDTYNQWVFMGVQQSTRAGGPGGPAGTTGPRGNQPPQQPPRGFPPGTGPQQPPPRGLPAPPRGAGPQGNRGFDSRNFGN